ncbi:hypothetical protein ACQKII_18575 [Lysinibacillus sp. NPDC048646]|uniref:hypothetical protein n=1 Tax=Lysinibacillus sp. NPDC048646 TaxID=3390574 RepID=UPI003CFFD9FC
MRNLKIYLKQRAKYYIYYSILFIVLLICVTYFIGRPIHFVAPTIGMVTGYGILEVFNYKDWKKNKMNF